MDNLKNLYEKMKIGKEKVMAGAVLEVFYMAFFFVYKINQNNFPTNRLIIISTVIMFIGMITMIQWGNGYGVEQTNEVVDMLKYYPVDCRYIWRMIVRDTTIFSVIHLIIVLLSGLRMDINGAGFIKIFVCTMAVYGYMILFVWVGYGRMAGRKKGRKESLSLTCLLCGLCSIILWNVIISVIKI